MPAIDQRLGFHKVVKYNYFRGWHQQATVFELLINKDVWNEASEQHQHILAEACRASMADSFAEGEAMQFDALKKSIEENGVEIRQWSSEMLDVFRTTWEDVAAEESANDPFFAEVYAHMTSFREEYDL